MKQFKKLRTFSIKKSYFILVIKYKFAFPLKSKVYQEYLIIDKIGAGTSFKILLMNCWVLGLPFIVNVLIAEQIAPPFRFYMESIIIASHFILSNGSCTQR